MADGRGVFFDCPMNRLSNPDFIFISKERVEMKSGFAVFFIMHQEWSIQVVLLSAFHRLRK